MIGNSSRSWGTKTIKSFLYELRYSSAMERYEARSERNNFNYQLSSTRCKQFSIGPNLFATFCILIRLSIHTDGQDGETGPVL